MTPTSSSMPDQRHTPTMSSVWIKWEVVSVIYPGVVDGMEQKNGEGRLLVGFSVRVNSLMVLRRTSEIIVTLHIR
jgi:hypothetical protein